MEQLDPSINIEVNGYNQILFIIYYKILHLLSLNIECFTFDPQNVLNFK